MKQVSNILKSISYAVLSVTSGLLALLLMLFRIDETPLEGSPAGALIVLGSLGLVAFTVFFIYHRLFFGPLRSIHVDLRGHLHRAGASYLLMLVGMLASFVGVTDDGLVIIPDRHFLEAIRSGPMVLAMIPVVADALRVALARILQRSESARV